MQRAPSVRVTLAPSRTALHALGVAAAIVSTVVLTLPLPVVPTACLVAAVLAWAADRARVIGLRRGPRAVCHLDVGAGLDLQLRFGDGRTRDGRVRGASCVTHFVTTIVWRPERCIFSRSVLVLPDMLPGEDFRRLRVLLRYGRSEPTHGAPASQA